MSIQDMVLHFGDCLDVLPTYAYPDNHFESVVTDAPYGLSKEPNIEEVLRHWLAGDDYKHNSKGFMGRSWDSFVPGPSRWREIFRVLKPGGHLVTCAGTRTVDLMTIAIRMGGFQIRDSIIGPAAWVYGASFPKGQNVAKAIDKKLGVKGEVVGRATGKGYTSVQKKRKALGDRPYTNGLPSERADLDITAPATPEALQWDGWNIALKCTHEPIVLARKPFKGTVEANVRKWGTGALNIAACRVGNASTVRMATGGGYDGGWGPLTTSGSSDGRWPPNFLLAHSPGCVRVGERRVKAHKHSGKPGNGLDGQVYGRGIVMTGETRCYADADGMEIVATFDCTPDCPVRLLDEQTGVLKSGALNRANITASNKIYGAAPKHLEGEYAPNEGGASRFFPVFEWDPDLDFFPFLYSGKASKSERNEGLVVFTNTHPTVKPVALMRWLARLITPPGGHILDPFMGSGTTGVAAFQEGFRFTGIELEQESLDISQARIEYAVSMGRQLSLFEATA